MLMAGEFKGSLLGSARLVQGYEMRESAPAGGSAGGWALFGEAYEGAAQGIALLPGTSLAADIPASTATTTSVGIGGNVRSSIGSVGDHDWIRVELVAGESYAFGLTGVGTSPLGDPYLDLRNSDGTIIASDDDGGGNFNSLLRFTATTSGTYYLDAHAYDTETGNYKLTAETAEPVGLLDSIDWGTQVSGSSLTVYFATTGQRFDGTTAGANWTDAEKAAVLAAFGAFSDVANITFAETNSSGAATFVLLKADLGADTLGYCNPPGETNAGVGVFNHTHSTWSDQSLQPGGYAFVTLVHEFGHGLGLAHPHDNGGTSTVMPGVTSSFDSYGNSGLNQGVYTVMSYNDGWATGPNGINANQSNYGWMGTLSPLDIAVIQEKYGADTTVNTGDNSYILADANAAGTMYAAIWDTAGTDTITYTGSRNAHIDLRAATLLDAAGGGGYVSYVTGVIGGYTIANGVVVENATGGSGDDSLRGNSSDNILTGNGGNDTLNGSGGNDTAVYSGSESDYSVTTNGDGSQTVLDLRSGSPDGTDTLISIETITFLGDEVPPPTGEGEVITGTPGRDTLNGTSGNDTINAGGGTDRVYGGDGDDTIKGQGGPDRLFGENGNDTILGGGGEDTLFGGDGADDLSGNSGRDDLRGGTGDDTMAGGGGSDYFTGGAGNDYIDGGGGDYDRAIYTGNYADYSFYYNPGSDQVRLTDTRDGRPDGVDRLVKVELLVFADGVVTVNGGSFDFQPNAGAVTLPAAATAAGHASASLAVLPGIAAGSNIAKDGHAPVMDFLDLSHDATPLLVAGDGIGPLSVLSGIGLMADGWAVFLADDGAAVQAPGAAAGWTLLSDVPDQTVSDGPAAVLPIQPAELPVEWMTPVDAWELVETDREPSHHAMDVSGWA